MPSAAIHPGIETYHAPHTKNCRNIMIDKRVESRGTKVG
jgi:hypothetical protein